MLEPLGIAPEVEELYLALAPLPPQTLAGAATAAERPEAKVAELLAELRRLGLATQTEEDQWQVLPLIDVTKALKAQRQEEIDAAFHAAEVLHGQMLAATHSHSDDIQTMVGRESIVHLQREMCAGAKNEICGFDRPPYVVEMNASIEDLMADSPEFQALLRGVSVRSIYHPGFDSERLSNLAVFMSHGEQARIGQVPLKLLLVDNQIGLIPSMRSYEPGHELTATVIRHPMILEAFQWLFETVWNSSVSALSANAQEDPRRETLISLLMTGSTDTAIAGQLGVNERSVRRYVADLMDEFGVTTRFQLGAALVRAEHLQRST